MNGLWLYVIDNVLRVEFVRNFYSERVCRYPNLAIHLKANKDSDIAITVPNTLYFFAFLS